jgi:hypothetical protein
MISNYKNVIQHPSRTGPGRPKLFEPGLKHALLQFCLARQRERIPATISDVIDYLPQKLIMAARWWVARFIERHEVDLTVQKASVPEHPRYEVAPDDVKRYFDILREDR